jgi:branched-chain amino acid transport system permease protein
MELFTGAVISGITIGILYGLLGFLIVLLYKCTGVANFAQGNIATFLTFVVFVTMRSVGFGILPALGVGLAAAAALGALLYLVGLRVHADTADHVNILMRTLALYLLLAGVISVRWSRGEPFAFPTVFPRGALHAGLIDISYQSAGATGVAGVLALLFWLFFKRTETGLLFLATAERRDIAQLLGVDTRRLTMIAWVLAAVVSLLVGVLVAPTNLLAANMMDLFLLYSFTAVILGGLTSLPGVFAGGVIVGVIGNVVTVYTDDDSSVIAVFGLLLLVLLVRPSGLFGDPSLKRV